MQIRTLFTVILLLFLVACTPGTTPTPDGGEAPTPTTIVPATPEQGGAEPTTTPQDGGAMPTPEATTVPTDTVATPLPVEPTTPPAGAGLGEGTLTPLAPLPADTLQVKAPFQERFFPYLVARRAEMQQGPAPIPSTLFVLDTASGESWEVTRACDDFTCEFTWLSNGQLLWLEEGTVFVADADGQNRRELEAPVGMTEIFGVSPTDVAVMRGGEGDDLYRLYMPDGTFDAVPEAQPNTGVVPDFTAQNDLLYFTADGALAGLSYTAMLNNANGGTKIIVLPLEPGSVPSLLAAPTGFEYPGRGGPMPLPPVPLPGTPYWMPTEMLWLIQGEQRIPTPLVIDAITGEFVNLERLTGLGDNGYSILYTQLSPDRKWMAAFVQQAPANQPPPDNIQRFYVAPTSNLASGIILTGTVEGWLSNPPALVLKEYGETSNSLSWVSLPDGAKTPLISDIELYVFGNNMSTEQAIFVQPNRFEGILGVVSPDGSLEATVQLPPRTVRYDDINVERRVEPVYASGVNLYVLGGDPASADSEQTYLWQWNAVE